MMRNRLRRSAREAVRNEYGEHVIYLSLKNPCEHFCRKMAKFRLSAEEVFMECLAVLDDIKEDESKAVFNMGNLWDRMYNDFRDLSDDGTEEKELALAVNVVMYCVSMCLIVTKKSLHNTLALCLMEQMDEHDACMEELRNTFMPNVYRLGEEKLRAVVIEYIQSDVFLSDTIEEMVENAVDNGKVSLLDSSPRVETADLKIADGKETSMLVVLDCMYKAKWFVDRKGKPVKNKEKTIKQIMRYAFNKKETNVGQLLNAAYKRNKSDIQDYFDELLENLPQND